MLTKYLGPVQHPDGVDPPDPERHDQGEGPDLRHGLLHCRRRRQDCRPSQGKSSIEITDFFYQWPNARGEI